MQAQDIFNAVVKHLFEQGKRSVDERHCRYHSEDGLKCSVGILVPMDAYFEEMDQGNRTIKALITEYPDKFPEWMVENLGLLSELQCVHDRHYNWEDPENMRKALKKTAEAYKLNDRILDYVDDFEVEEQKIDE